jgi:lipid-A-disaccharide synthase
VVACSTNLSLEFYKNLVADDTQLVFGRTYAILEKANLALVTSGTATLETALFEVPQVVCYATSPISFRIAKLLVKIKFISLVNLILDKELVKELIQGDCTSKNMVHYLKKLEDGSPERTSLTSNYKILIESLGNEGASDRVAADILETFFAK